MKTLTVNEVEYWLPESVPELKEIIQYAQETKRTIMVRGSGHSFPMIGQAEAARQSIYVMLSYLNKVTFDRANFLVTAEAGCHLGYDPNDPSGISTLENSLLFQLDPLNDDGQRPDLNGWSLPDLGGISHQTIGGFMATGSSGGSTRHAFESAIVCVSVLYYGHKDVTDPESPMGVHERTFHRPHHHDPDNDFFGVGFANLGMMGIVTSVTFSCTPTFELPTGTVLRTFDIEGSETTTRLDECGIDLFGAGHDSLQHFLQETEYTRLIWWPQKSKGDLPDTERIVVWQAKRVLPEIKPASAYKPYQEVDYILGSPLPETIAADLLFTAIGQWPTWFENMLGPKVLINPLAPFEQAVEKLVSEHRDSLFQDLLNLFVTLGKPAKQFNDIGWRGLPMDNQMSDKLFPVWFTELWISIDQTAAVMTALKAFYEESPENAGTFCCELYAAGRNDFWLSPAYQQDVIRIDVFWFANNQGDPVAYYSRFWNLLRPFNFRPHWGKYMPDPSQDTSWAGYLAARYPKWQKWNTLRQQMDPCQLFVTDYWRNRLAIPALP